jgi:hypothetical protein
MKKISLVVLLLFMSLIFSFEIIHAQVQTDVADKLVEIKEIRQSIRHHLKNNKKLEGEIEKKSKQIEKVLVRLPENSLVSQQVVDQELNPKLEGIMTQLMQISEYETASWKYLNRGNKQLQNKKYDAGIKSLKQADIALKDKNEVMIRFKEDLDEFLVFVNSLQHK